jgi:phosphonate transport system permease protein
LANSSKGPDILSSADRGASAAHAAAARFVAIERAERQWSAPRIRVWIGGALVLAFYVASWQLAQVDPAKLIEGLPKLGHWLAQAWPPALDEMPLFLHRTAETVAMAAIGTTTATLLAIPAAVLASRNITPFPGLYYPMRWFLNGLRGIDSFVFALLFVAAVGLGPFAGVLGIALHTWGSAAKLFADHIESVNLGPFEAVATTGAGRWTTIAYALVPDVAPVMLSTMLFWWEFNVRASTVLGVVGAGGIGQELKNSMDLLDFSRLFTIIAVILVVVTVLDQLSGWLRRRLV